MPVRKVTKVKLPNPISNYLWADVVSENVFDIRKAFSSLPTLAGVVAQLVEHHNGIVGVRSSNLLGSTSLKFGLFQA
jgi:hypothetical protein